MEYMYTARKHRPEAEFYFSWLLPRVTSFGSETTMMHEWLCGDGAKFEIMVKPEILEKRKVKDQIDDPLPPKRNHFVFLRLQLILR